MFRVGVLLVALLLSIGWHAPARASGDFSCSPGWKTGHRMLTDCDNMALLAPGNDTRVNIVLLLLDRDAAGQRNAGPAPATPEALFDWQSFRDRLFPRPDASADSSYADGEGSRCRSNASGAAGFEAAVNAARKLPDGERADLIAARRGLQPSCAGQGAAAAAVASATERVKSPAGAMFAHYLLGAAAFYDGDYDAAAMHFSALKAADQPWLKETARYMLGRVEVNRAQIDAFDDYGYPKDPSQIDARTIAAAETALRGYLQAYPGGLYAVSARGLLRRVYWLGGDTRKLAAEYAALFAQDPAARGIDAATLAEELDTKLLPRIKAADTTDPILLTVLDLVRMRGPESAADGECCGTPIALDELKAQRASFAKEPALFEYLLAAHAWFVAKKPAEILPLLPDAARQASFGPVQFSRQMLRGMALDAVGDRNARGFWIEMLPGAKRAFQRPALELALAMHDERSGGLERVFAPGSPIRSPAIREILLTNVAGAPLLRRQAGDKSVPQHEREIALFTLLYKEVTRGAYRDFLADLATVPAGAPADGNIYDILSTEHPPAGIFTLSTRLEEYDCPPLKEIAGQLAKDPHAAKARLCLTDYMRVTGFDDFSLDRQPAKDELGGTASLFPGPAFSRLEIYKAIMADAGATPADKAYALYRAVNCYAPSRTNACGGAGVPIAQRKAWFLRLKKDYPTSSWAQSLRYYW